MKYLIFLLFLISTALAWDWDTHYWSAEQLCTYLDCGDCIEQLKTGAVAPDKDFRDTINHHCYPDDCPAIEKSDEWLLKSQNETGCGKYYSIGVASHYFMDSKVYWHQVKNEDYEKCHAPFETKAGNHIYDAAFTVTQCNATVTKQDLLNYLSEFELNFKPSEKYLSSPTADAILFVEKNKEIAGIILFCLLLVFAIMKKFKKKKRGI